MVFGEVSMPTFTVLNEKIPNDLLPHGFHSSSPSIVNGNGRGHKETGKRMNEKCERPQAQNISAN